MTYFLLLAATWNLAWSEASVVIGVEHLNLMLLQGLIVLRSGEGGG